MLGLSGCERAMQLEQTASGAEHLVAPKQAWPEDYGWDIWILVGILDLRRGTARS